MSGETAQTAKIRTPEEEVRTLRAQVEALRVQNETLQMRLAEHKQLVEQGFQSFMDASERFEGLQKDLQKKVEALTIERDQKNEELERNLHEKEEVKTYLSNIYESLAEGVLVTDLRGGITSVNRAGVEMLGLGVEELAGHMVNEILGAKLVPPVPAAGGSPEEAIPYEGKDGEIHMFLVTISQMTDEGGSPLGYILNLQDVTLLKKLQEHAERRNRFTAMGEMAANIAHEIRNPLGSIELFSSLVKKSLSEDDDKMELMNHISTGISSMNHIISNLLEYSKPRPVTLEEMDLNDLIEEVSEFIRFTAEQHQVELTEELAEGAFRIRGDREHLKQVFHNLLLNGIQAMPEGGHIEISSRSRAITNTKMLTRMGNPSTAKGKKRKVVEVSIKDNGCGMPEEIQRQIFDPFFTTKARGTGLGLAIVHNIIESHHGIIDVESEVNTGTNFILMFPLLEN